MVWICHDRKTTIPTTLITFHLVPRIASPPAANGSSAKPPDSRYITAPAPPRWAEVDIAPGHATIPATGSRQPLYRPFDQSSRALARSPFERIVPSDRASRPSHRRHPVRNDKSTGATSNRCRDYPSGLERVNKRRHY